MELTPLPPEQHFSVKRSTLESFEGKPAYYRLNGPIRLVRLVQFEKVTREGETLRASRKDGEFWFNDEMFSQLRRHAEADLRRQTAKDKKTYKTSIDGLVGLYMKYCLREKLAISKDWTTDLDAYMMLALGAADSVVTLAGRAKGQPYYSEKDQRHAETLDLNLSGQQRQYVIDFDLPVNAPMVSRLIGPTLF